jgi:hypothetical protein
MVTRWLSTSFLTLSPPDQGQRGATRGSALVSLRAVLVAVVCLAWPGLAAGPSSGQVSADFDGSGTVDFVDFFLLADAFGVAAPDARYDLTGDGAVDFADFLVFADRFGGDGQTSQQPTGNGGADANVPGGGGVPGPAQAPGKPSGLWSSFDAQALALTLHWTRGPGPSPLGYAVEYRLEPAGPWLPSSGTADMAAPSFTGHVPPGMYEALALDVRVTALGSEGLRSEPSNPLHIIVPPVPLATSQRFVVASSAGTRLADHATLLAKGLDTFPDGLVSVVPTGVPGVYDFYANQGNASDGMGGSLGTGYGRTRGTLADPLAAVLNTRGPIAHPIVPVDYMGGGAVWRDAVTGALVMLYHREVYTREGGVPTGAFWSSIGAAVSTDGGSTFVDAGEVLTPDLELLSPHRGPSGNGPGDLSTLVRDGWLYAYYNDNLEDGTMVLAVARTSVAGLSAMAVSGAAPAFWKYRDGSFSEPGLGGTPSAIATGFNPSVAYSSCRDEFIMVATNYTSDTGSMLSIMTSSDGFHWSAPEGLYPALAPYRIYNTLLGDRVSPEGNRVVTGAALKVLAVDFPSSTDFWSAQQVRVIEITDTAANAGCRR